MKIGIEETTVRIVALAPEGRIDAFVAQELRAVIDGQIASGATHFVCDLTNVTFLDSAGMAVLVSLLKRARQAGGDVKLVKSAYEAAQRILHLTKFDRVFEIVDRREDAMKRFVR